MGGRGSGRIKLKKEKPAVTLRSIIIDNNMHYGAQVKKIREYYGYTLDDFSKKLGSNAGSVYHMENATGGYAAQKNKPALSKPLTKYLKALGLKEVIIKL